MTTLYEHVMRQWVHDALKHDLHPEPEQYAQEQFNALTPAEQLRGISDAMEELFPYWMRSK